MTPQHATLAIQQAVFTKLWDRPGKGPQSPTATTGCEIRLALRALRRSRKADRVTRTACGALQDLLLTEQDCQVALDANAVHILTATLLHHGASPAVMTSGLSALLQLTKTDRAHAQLMQSDVLPLLVCAMRQHKSQWDVAALGLALLVQLSATPKGRWLLFAAHAMVFAIDAMLTHPRNATIQCLGCELVFHVAHGSAAQLLLLSLGAVEMVVEAVRQLPQERKLVQRALSTLCRLCETDQTRTAMGQVGGVAAVLRAVDCNHEDAVIARCGCKLLYHLTLNGPVHQEMLTTDVRALVEKVLSHHVQRPKGDHSPPDSVVEGRRA